MSEREGQTPPDWALPGWDAVDPDEPVAVGPGRGVAPGEGPAELRPSAVAPGTFGLRILKVSDVTRAVRTAIRQDPRLLDVWVEGEIGRVTVSSAGHAYFALKDERNQLQCVWFRDDRERSLFAAQAGLRVVVHGRIDLYEPTGAMQLYVDSIQPAGVGDLALRFEALKARLDAEGLFDSARKRPLPSRPRTIAVITSPSGAVWRDVSHVLRASMAAGPGHPGGRAGAGRWRAAEHRHRLPPRRALCIGDASRRADPTMPRCSRSWPVVAARSRTSGRSTTSASYEPSSRIRCQWSAGWGTRST